MKDEILKTIYDESKSQKKKLTKMFQEHPDMERDLASFLESYRPLLRDIDVEPKELAKAYLQMVEEMKMARLVFARTGKYPAHDQSEALDQVYSNPEQMKPYMLGLGLSQFLWPQHYRLYRFFQEMLDDLRFDSQDRCLEVGCGHGLFLLELLRRLPSQTVDAIDISQTSIDLTESAVQAILPERRSQVNFQLNDVLELQTDLRYRLIVVGEVLEHVHQPEKVLAFVKQHLAENGVAYLTTCANCPTIDHVYHFSCIDQIRQLIKASDLDVVKEVIAPAEEMSPEKLEKFKVDIIYGAIVRKSQ